MSHTHSNSSLRRRAEDQNQLTSTIRETTAPEMTPQAAHSLIHELQVHQIELEMQNEELRRTQIELDLLRARYFDLYDLAPVGYCSIDSNGLLVEANLHAATLLGLSRTQLVGLRISQLIRKTDQDVYYQCRGNLLATGQAQRCELRMVKGDQSDLWVTLVIISAQNPDETTGIRMVVADISERRAQDHAMQAKNIELEHARLAADTANLAKSEFLSSMSHELRTPLNAILGFAQLMELGSPTATQQASIDQILRAGWYLLELIDDVLDLALIESSKIALVLEPISLNEALQACEGLIQAQAEQSHITVRFLPLAHPFSIKADVTRTRQVLINLLSNAIKYNVEGGSVEVSCSQRGAGRIRIQVRDTGNGLPAEKMAQLFQPFNRLGQENGPTKGTGIGLVMSQRLVKLMEGEMGVESTVGVGSVFWFELNLAAPLPQDKEADSPASTSQLAHASHRLAPKTVLYVEDNPANMALIEQLLATREGLHLIGAQDAMHGIALAHTLAPDVIVMDINLPGINGYEALMILKKDAATAHIPVLAISANAMPGDVELGLAAGFFRYLTKPIRLNELMAALEEGLLAAQARVSPPPH